MRNLLRMAAALRDRSVSARELVEESLALLERLEPKLNAFMTVTADQARSRADQIDREIANGALEGAGRSLMFGIPIAHKDLIRTKGVPTTAGSKIFAGYVPKKDAAIAAKLEQAGAIMIGKTGLHELAYGVTSTNVHFGAIHNPWDLSRIPGGSSGGSAAAVSAGIVPFATGTDTGGSIRVPASFCGIVGFKPTFGRISTKGVLPLGYTLDHVGPMTRTVRDAAAAFQAMADAPTGYVPPPDLDLRGVRIGWPSAFYTERVDPEVLDSVRDALNTAEAAGASVIEIGLPDMEAVTKAAATTLLVEAVDALRPFLKRRDLFSDEVLGRLDRGATIPGYEYVAAQRLRRKTGKFFAEIFTRVDCIFTPATPILAPEIGKTHVMIGGAAEEVRAAATRFTRGMNLLGLPAISIPCGFSRNILPIGLQIIGARNQDDTVLRIAAAMEDAMGIAESEPPI